MFVGFKVYDSTAFNFYQPLLDRVDFIEVMAAKDRDYSFLKGAGQPVVIHNMHYGFGVNFANGRLYEVNKASLELSLMLADRVNAKTVIIHPERVEDSACSEDNIAALLSEYDDKRIIIESMPYSAGGFRFYAYDRDSIKRLTSRLGCGLCLDFAHSSEAARKLGMDLVGFISEINSLKPRHYHISDTKVETGRDMHMHLGVGDLPLEEFKKLIPKNARVTVETPHDDMEKALSDVRFLKG